MEDRKKILGSFLLLVTAIIWGSSFFIVKNTVDNVAPCWLIAIRFSGAALILALVGLRRLRQMNRKTLAGGLLIGIALFGAYVAQTYGVAFTTPGKNAFLTAIYCVLVPFFWWAMTRKRPDGWSFAAAFICLAGIGLISLDGTLSISLGDGLSLLSGVLFALQIALISLYTRDCDPVVLTVLQFAVGGLLAWPFALGAETVPDIGTPEILGVLFYLTVVVSALGMLLQNIGQSMTPSGTAAILMCLESVFGVLFSVIFWGETVSGQALAGFVLVFFAVLVSETKLSFLRRKKPA